MKDKDCYVKPKTTPFLIGLWLWAYSILFHIDWQGAILNGIGILLCIYAMTQGKIESKKGK